MPEDRPPPGFEPASWLIPIAAVGVTIVVFIIGAGLRATSGRLSMPDTPHLTGVGLDRLHASPMGVFIVGMIATASWVAAWTTATWWRARGAYVGAKAGLPLARAAKWSAFWIMIGVAVVVFLVLAGMTGLVPGWI
jgi:hypothetical protein